MKRWSLLLSVLLIAGGAPLVFAHEGHDNAPSTGGTAIPGRHVLAAASERYEVLLKNDPLTPGLKSTLDVYLSDFRTNAPIEKARVGLSLRSASRELWSAPAAATSRAGLYTAPFQAPSDTGTFTVLMTVVAAGDSDARTPYEDHARTGEASNDAMVRPPRALGDVAVVAGA